MFYPPPGDSGCTRLSIQVMKSVRVRRGNATAVEKCDRGASSNDKHQASDQRSGIPVIVGSE